MWVVYMGKTTFCTDHDFEDKYVAELDGERSVYRVVECSTTYCRISEKVTSW